MYNQEKEIIQYDLEYNILHLLPEILIEIEYNKQLNLSKIIFFNPEKFYRFYQNQLNQVDFNEFNQKYISMIEKEPEKFYYLIKNPASFKEVLQELPEKKEIPFQLRLYSLPELHNKNSNYSNTIDSFVVFCKLNFIKETQNIYKALLFIQDIGYDNYFLKVITESSPIGLFLYRETFKYVNEEFCNITGYSKQELYQMPLWEVADDSIKEQIKQIAQNRIEGKLIEKRYNEAPIKTKSGQIKWLMVYANTILYKGNYYGIGLVIDITEKKLQEEKNKQLNRLYQTLLQIQNTLLTKNNTKDILNEISKILINSEQFLLVWIGQEESDKSIHPIIVHYRNGFYKNYLENLTISSDINSPYGKGPTGTAHRENRIIVNNNTLENPDIKPWQKKQIEFGFFSSCSIPIRTIEANYSINLYTNIVNYFNEEELELLKFIKLNIEFTLHKIYQNQWLNVFQKVIEEAPITFFITNEKNEIIFSNPYLEKITGYFFEEIHYKDPKIFSSYLHPKEFYQKLWNTLLNKESFNETFLNRKKNGDIFYLHQTIVPIIENNKIIKFAALGIDITEKLQLEEQLQIKFLYDPITKLPNRKLFIEELEQFLNFNKNPFVLIDIDIDKFHYINEYYGNLIGDFYLKQFSKILISVLNQFSLKYFICRKGDDDFLILILLDNNTSKEQIILFLEELQIQCKKDYVITNPHIHQEITVNFSYHAGISFYPEDLKEPNIKEPKIIIDHMLKNVENALFNAKKEIEFSYKFFQKEMQEKISDFLFLKENLNKAIKNKEFKIFYQPYFSTKDMSIVGGEALIRWFHQGNIISPAKFIPFLEETGQLVEVENLIFDMVFEFYKNLLSINKILNISINISPVTLYKSNFIDRVLQKIKEFQIDPSYLVFEITESSLIKDFEYTISIINELKKIKIQFALDDFGSGYSSLTYLEKLPISILKIDRELIKEISYNVKKISIIKMILQLAKQLNLKTIAEGVEKPEELEILKNLDCDYIQGFLLGKPVPEEEFFKQIK